jgi:hypothetical protein
MSSPSGRWTISFACLRDWYDGKRLNGFLAFWSTKNWLVILDNLDNPLVGRSVEKGETIHMGSLVHFNNHIAKVQSCLFSPWPSKEPSPLRWNVLCSSFVKGDWSDQCHAVLLLRPIAKILVLLDKDEVVIDARFLLEGEIISARISIDIPVHKVTAGQKINDINYVKKQTQVASNQVPAPPSLDFSRGLKFELDIKSKFGHSVNFVPGFQKREFLLVISFGHANFKLNTHTLGLAIQSYFGGIASKFHVVCLKERVFRFSAAS